MLESIAAAVIAGVSLRGGVGRVEMVALAALFLSILTNAMNLLRIDPQDPDDLPRRHRRPAVALDEIGQAEGARRLTPKPSTASADRAAGSSDWLLAFSLPLLDGARWS